MKSKFLITIVLISWILLTAQGCRYTDYIKEKLMKQEAVSEGEVCVKIGGEVICGTPSEIKALQEEETKEEPVEVGELPVKEVTELDLVSFPNLKAVDPDGDLIVYNFTSPLNSKGEWQTKEGDAGEYVVTVYASDGKSTVFQDVEIIVKKFNHPPVLERIDDITVEEGGTVILNPEYSDVDGQELTVAYSGWMDSGEYTTTYDDAGEYVVTVTVSDGEKTTSHDVIITVNNINRAPVLELAENIEGIEKQLISIDAKTADPDGDTLSMTYSAPFDENGEWQTAVGDHGDYTIKVTVSDGDLSSAKSTQVFIEYFDKPPYFEDMEDITVDETEMVILRPLAFDPEGKEITFAYSGWMDSETRKTTYDDAGEYEVTITASDGFNEVKQTIKIIVNNVNRPPIFEEGAFG